MGARGWRGSINFWTLYLYALPPEYVVCAVAHELGHLLDFRTRGGDAPEPREDMDRERIADAMVAVWGLKANQCLRFMSEHGKAFPDPEDYV